MSWTCQGNEFLLSPSFFPSSPGTFFHYIVMVEKKESQRREQK